MRTTALLKRGLTKIHRDWQAGRYGRALAAIDELLQAWPDNPRLLIMRAQLIQLQANENAPALDQAKAALRRAVDLDEESPAALIELGHFLFAVDDNAAAASKCFTKAIALCKGLLKDALVGKAEALSELKRQPDALACLAEAYWLQSHDGKSTTASRREEILERLEGLRQAE
jgi:tetratricopeptide (TPR) repeat protein